MSGDSLLCLSNRIILFFLFLVSLCRLSYSPVNLSRMLDYPLHLCVYVQHSWQVRLVFYLIASLLWEQVKPISQIFILVRELKVLKLSLLILLRKAQKFFPQLQIGLEHLFYHVYAEDESVSCILPHQKLGGDIWLRLCWRREGPKGHIQIFKSLLLVLHEWLHVCV